MSVPNRPAPLNGNSFAGLPRVKRRRPLPGKIGRKPLLKGSVSRAAGLHGLANEANRFEQQCVMPKNCDREITYWPSSEPCRESACDPLLPPCPASDEAC